MVTLARPRPAGRLRLGRLLGINAFWFGGGAHWPPILGPLLTVGATLVVGSQADLLIGKVTAAGAVFAALVPLAAGWLSDLTASRWGRRRPWMVAGTLLNLIGLGLLALAGSPLLLILAFLLVQISNNAAGAAYAGVIPDCVPEDQRGQASGLLGTMNLLGTVVGFGLVTLIFGVLGSNRSGLIASYACIAVIMLISLVVSVIAIDEPPSMSAGSRRLPPLRAAAIVCAGAFVASLACIYALILVPLGALTPIVLALAAASVAVTVASGLRLPALRGFLAPLRDNDFFWVFATRLLVQMGLISIYTFVGLYFRDVVGGPNYGFASSLWLLTLLIGGVVTAVVGGYLSDRTGRRKVFVYISSGLQAAVVLVMAFGLVKSLPLLYLLGTIYGLGFGTYYAVDWALACDVLPDRERAAGKDMSLWHTSLTIPQAVAPAILAEVLHYLNQPGHSLFGMASGNNLGFRVIFGTAAVWYVLGTIMVGRIRTVR
jgi:MFS family permease